MGKNINAMVLYTPEEIRAIMEANYDKSMDLPSFYDNVLRDLGLKAKPIDCTLPPPIEKMLSIMQKANDEIKNILGVSSEKVGQSSKLGEWKPSETWKENFSMMIPQQAHNPKPTEPKKEWEILKMVHPKTKSVVGDGSVFDRIMIAEKSKGNMKEWNITSVKRLPDGEIFNVGENVAYKRHPENCFNIFKMTIMMDMVLLCDDGGNSVSLRSAIKVPAKTPLFTSEDGVPIYEDSELWWLRLSGGVIRQWDRTFPLKEKLFQNGFKYFSTEAAAKQYWEKHKPKIEVRKILPMDKVTEWPDYVFSTSVRIPEQKLPAIKQAIEDILNDKK